MGHVSACNQRINPITTNLHNHHHGPRPSFIKDQFSKCSLRISVTVNGRTRCLFAQKSTFCSTSRADGSQFICNRVTSVLHIHAVHINQFNVTCNIQPNMFSWCYLDSTISIQRHLQYPTQHVFLMLFGLNHINSNHVIAKRISAANEQLISAKKISMSIKYFERKLPNWILNWSRFKSVGDL